MRPEITKRLNYPNVKVINYKDCKCEMIYDEATEEYFYDIGELQDYYDNNTDSLPYPQYVYGTYFEPVQLNLDYILENACEEHAEDIINCLNGVEELREAINRFNEANKKTGSYYEDFKTVVKLNWEE